MCRAWTTEAVTRCRATINGPAVVPQVTGSTSRLSRAVLTTRLMPSSPSPSLSQRRPKKRAVFLVRSLPNERTRERTKGRTNYANKSRFRFEDPVRNNKLQSKQNRTKQNRTEQNKTEQNKTRFAQGSPSRTNRKQTNAFHSEETLQKRTAKPTRFAWRPFRTSGALEHTRFVREPFHRTSRKLPRFSSSVPSR